MKSTVLCLTIFAIDVFAAHLPTTGTSIAKSSSSSENDSQESGSKVPTLKHLALSAITQSFGDNHANTQLIHDNKHIIGDAIFTLKEPLVVSLKTPQSVVKFLATFSPTTWSRLICPQELVVPIMDGLVHHTLPQLPALNALHIWIWLIKHRQVLPENYDSWIPETQEWSLQRIQSIADAAYEHLRPLLRSLPSFKAQPNHEGAGELMLLFGKCPPRFVYPLLTHQVQHKTPGLVWLRHWCTCTETIGAPLFRDSAHHIIRRPPLYILPRMYNPGEVTRVYFSLDQYSAYVQHHPKQSQFIYHLGLYLIDRHPSDHEFWTAIQIPNLSIKQEYMQHLNDIFLAWLYSPQTHTWSRILALIEIGHQHGHFPGGKVIIPHLEPDDIVQGILRLNSVDTIKHMVNTFECAYNLVYPIWTSVMYTTRDDGWKGVLRDWVRQTLSTSPMVIPKKDQYILAPMTDPVQVKRFLYIVTQGRSESVLRKFVHVDLSTPQAQAAWTQGEILFKQATMDI